MIYSRKIASVTNAVVQTGTLSPRLNFAQTQIGPANRRGRILKLETNYTLKDEPHPHVLLVFGFSNLKPAASSVST